MAPVVVLNVAEKPSVARALAQVFGSEPGSRPRPGAGGGGAAQVFECDNVAFPALARQGQGRMAPPAARDEAHTMVTTSVRGHLASQDFGPAYGWSRCPPAALFEAPIVTGYADDMRPLERLLATQAKRASALILWLDCDREGEAIADEVRTACLRGNPRLGTAGRVYRARFSTVLAGEIRRALRTLGRVDENFVAAVQLRSEHDLRVGASFTRFQTLRLQKRFDSFQERGVVSYGPCQFPTLGFVVERWARIETFVKEAFWSLEMTIRLHADGSVVHAPQQQDPNQNQTGRPPGPQSSGSGSGRPIHLNWRRVRLYDRPATLALYDACLEAGAAVVTAVAGRPKNKWRPVPLATVELQKRASKYLRIGSEELMQKAEELYNQGYISYPRTETEKFRAEFDHHALIQSFQAVAGEFGDYSTHLLADNNFQNPRAGQNDDNAHPPITPAKACDPASIADPVQRKIYSLVAKHYLACCSRDAVGRETELTLRIASEEFVAKGLMILERNWLEIYQPWERWSTGQGELPKASVGTRITPTSLIMKDGQTQPPQLISEVELISLMDKNGIGTDATIAQHITTICDRNYAEKDGNQRFHPTKLGIALVEGYNSMGYQLNKPDLRREMEAECNAVAGGRKSKEAVLGPVLAKMLECFKRANLEANKLDEAVARHFDRLGSNNSRYVLLQADFSRCGTCNGSMALKQQAGDGERRGANPGRNQSNLGPSKLLHCPTCSQAHLLPRYHQQVSPAMKPGDPREPLTCPICRFQLVKCENDGKSYHACPKCFSDPPVDHGGDPSTDFPCSRCTHPTCALATGVRGGDVAAFPCPFCAAEGNAGGVHLRRSATGFRLACGNGGKDGCQFVVWLPKAARDISVRGGAEEDGAAGEAAVCRHCSAPNKPVRKLTFAWKVGSVPPHYDREMTACVLCDTHLKSDMDIRIPSVNQVQPRRTGGTGGGRGRGRGRGRGAAPAGAGRNAGRGENGGRGAPGPGGIQCFKCGGPHYANACPNNPRR